MQSAPKKQLPLGIAPQIGAVGLQPFESRNIRLSSALCALGFALNIEKEPATVVVDFETQKPVVSFWHNPILPEDSLIRKQLPTLTAYMVGMWWGKPSDYLIEGYDDALSAMRRVFEAREWLIGVTKNGLGVPCDGRRITRSVATESLHIASVIRACEIPLLAFDKGTFIFGKAASRIATLIDAAEGASAAVSREIPDSCVDWMLWALKYRDWLHRIVRQPDCIPLIEKRDGARCLRIRADMPKTLRREFTRRF